MHTRRPLDHTELDEALAALVGARVSVRVVERADPERLLVVLEGVLGPKSNEKAPSAFWPLGDGLPQRARAAERFGLVLHPDAVGAEERAGGHVLVIAQGAVIVNLRAL